MRVLYTHRTQGVGAEGAHILGMYEAFAELGHVTAMHCLPGCNPSERAAAGTAAGDNIKVIAGLPLLKKIYWAVAEVAPQILFEVFELAYNAPLFAQLGWRCLRFKPDLVYERYSLNTFAPTLVCRLLGIKHVLEINDSVVIERSRPLKLKSVSSFIEGFCLRGSDLSITITEKFRQQLLDRFVTAPKKILVFTNAVSHKRFNRDFQRETLRERLGLTEAKVIGGTGQFLEWHGLQDLVGQLGPLAREFDLHFLFVGDGPARKAISAQARALGVEDRVHFTGMLPISAVPDYLSVLDIAVIPKAAPHASPMKLIEYMAIGLPIVAPDLPSIRAALRDASRGKIFPAGDMARMKQAVLDFVRDPKAAADAGRRAREYVLGHLTWDCHARKVLAALSLLRLTCL
jgi:glycosyltransferase involved in cell wall biosynthesis